MSTIEGCCESRASHVTYEFEMRVQLSWRFELVGQGAHELSKRRLQALGDSLQAMIDHSPAPRNVQASSDTVGERPPSQMRRGFRDRGTQQPPHIVVEHDSTPCDARRTQRTNRTNITVVRSVKRYQTQEFIRKKHSRELHWIGSWCGLEWRWIECRANNKVNVGTVNRFRGHTLGRVQESETLEIPQSLWL